MSVPADQLARVVSHPLLAVHLTFLRAKTTTSGNFRRHLHEIARLLATEASRHWETETHEIETPLAAAPGARWKRPIALVPILRAGLGMAEAVSEMMPDAAIGHLGLYRDEKTLRPVTYYSRLPANIAASQILLLDPMLATGFSACEAIRILKAAGASRIQFLCLVSCDVGLRQLQSAHPDVPIFTAAIDPELNERGYIVPGLGDAGDRYFGTE